MSKYGKKPLSSVQQRLKDYQLGIYHNANAKWANELRVLGKNPQDDNKYDIDLDLMKETITSDCANYLPLEDHGGKELQNSDYSVSCQWYPSDTKHLFESNMADPTTKSLMNKIGWCDENNNPTQVIYNLDKNGFRCKDFKQERGKGILFLGCSHTFGVGLNQQDTFAFKVANHFDKECFNYGMPGKGLDTAALYTSLYLQDDIDVGYIDAVVVYCPPPGRVSYFSYNTEYDMGRGYNELEFLQLQNDYLLLTDYYDDSYLDNVPYDEMADIEELFNLKNAKSKYEVKKFLKAGLDQHVYKHRSAMWEHFMFTKENNFYRGLLAVNSIKSFCLENNIPLVLTEGSPTISTKHDWARDLGHFGPQTHNNIAQEIISKLEIYLDK